MAAVKVISFEFIANNPSGTFVTGDIVDIFYDPDTDTTSSGLYTFSGFTVQLNGSPILSGPTINRNTTTNQYYIFSSHLSSICKSTVLIKFSVSIFDHVFPYVFGVRDEDSPSCAVDPSTCDIQFIGVPVVTPASGQLNTDGEVTVLATSSAGTVQYKIGEDFSYGDVTAQTSGTFTDLLPGTYRIYARDPNNCSTSVQVMVGIDNTYNAEYRLQYYDRLGNPTRIELRRRAFAGSVTEDVCGTGEPFELLMRGENDTDKFRIIFGTEARLNLISLTNFQWHMVYTNDPKEIQLVYQKDFGAGYETLCTTFVLPFQYSESYGAPPYPVSITATDNLAELDGLYLADDSGLRFYGRIKAIELIAFCLKKTGLELNIRCACNIYSDLMARTDADDPLDQAYVNFDAYYLANDKPTLLYVIQQILKPFGARIVQWENRWNIVRVEELRGKYDYREFDANGKYISNGSFDPALTINCSGGINWVRRDQNMQILHGYGRVRVNYDMGLRENVLRNGDFRLKTIFNPLFQVFTLEIDTSGFQIVSPTYPLNVSREEIDENNVALGLTSTSTSTDGSSYLLSDVYKIKMGSDNTLKFAIRVKVPGPKTIIGDPIKVPYIKVRMQVTYGTYYLRGDGTWTTNAAFIIFYLEEFDKYTEFEVVAEQPDSGAVSGYDLAIKLFHPYVKHTDYHSVADVKAVTTTTLGIGTRLEALLTGFFTGSTFMCYYELEENTDDESNPDIIRPNDYHPTNNPVQWILKDHKFLEHIRPVHSMFIDFISLAFLTNGKPAVRGRIIDKKGEPRNNLELEKEIIHGSFQTIFTTLPRFGFSTGILGIPGSGPFQFTADTVNALSADLLYAGYLSDVNGVGYENWARDGVPESTTLEGTLLSSIVSQYNRSYRRLSGSLRPNVMIGFLNTFIEAADNNRKYIPMGIHIKDRHSEYSLELLELTDITDPGEGGSPFNSAFTVGFGPGYN